MPWLVPALNIVGGLALILFAVVLFLTVFRSVLAVIILRRAADKKARYVNRALSVTR
jgi:uncharacterized membrane protein